MKLENSKEQNMFIDCILTLGNSSRSLIDEIVRVKRQYEFTLKIIVAAVRNGRQIVDAAILGADIVTAGFNVYKEDFNQAYTSFGLTKFAEF